LGLSADGAILATGDNDALRTLLTNLIDNAVHYTPGGGTVDVTVKAEDGQACWIVTDNGPGIPLEDRQRVFDRFYRREGAGMGGSGLGLAIVQRVAQHHGATVELADGADGRGLRVIVRFPAQ
jgi:two-component system OmpR family sensor kinase